MHNKLKAHIVIIIAVILSLPVSLVEAREVVDNGYCIGFSMNYFVSSNDCKRSWNQGKPFYGSTDYTVNFSGGNKLSARTTTKDEINYLEACLIWHADNFYLADRSASFSSVVVKNIVKDIDDVGTESKTINLDEVPTTGAGEICDYNKSARCGWGRDERYTIKNMMFVEPPISIIYTGASTSRLYQAETAQLSFKLGTSPLTTSIPVDLEVALDNGENDSEWHIIEGLNLRSGDESIKLTYEMIVGAKDDVNSNYEAWIGKPLKFRAVRQMPNGQFSAGSIEAGFTFYTSPAFDFTVEEITRTYCDEGIEIVISFTEHNPEVPTMDIASYYTCQVLEKEEDSVNAIFDCDMTLLNPNEQGTASYKLTIKYKELLLKGKESPFETSQLPDWEVQLRSKSHPNELALSKAFTIPPKPQAPDIDELDSTLTGYFYEGEHYDLPHRAQCYAKVIISDEILRADNDSPFLFLDAVTEDTVPFFNITCASLETLLDSISKEDSIYVEQLWEDYSSSFAFNMAHFGDTAWWGYHDLLDDYLVDNNFFDHVIKRSNGYTVLQDHFEGVVNKEIYYYEDEKGRPYGIFDTTLFDALYDDLFKDNPDFAFDEEMLFDKVITKALEKDTKAEQWLYFYTHFAYHYLSPQLYPGLDISWKDEVTFPALTGVATNDYHFLDNGVVLNYIKLSDVDQCHNKDSFIYSNIYNSLVANLNYTLDSSSFIISYRHQDNEEYRAFNEFYCRLLDNELKYNYFEYFAREGATKAFSAYPTYPSDLYRMELSDWNFYDGFGSPFDESYKKQYIKETYANQVNDVLRQWVIDNTDDLSDYNGYPFDFNEFLYGHTLKWALYREYSNFPDADSEQYAHYKTLFIREWLLNVSGVRVYVEEFDTLYNLLLEDAEGCRYPFSVYVTAPENPIFEMTASEQPSDACSPDGLLTLKYLYGGIGPFVYGDELLLHNEEVTVDSLSWSDYETFSIIGDGFNNALPLEEDFVRGVDEHQWIAVEDTLIVEVTNQSCANSSAIVEVGIGSRYEGEATFWIEDENGIPIEGTEFTSTEKYLTIPLPPFEEMRVTSDSMRFMAKVRTVYGCEYAREFEVANQSFDMSASIIGQAEDLGDEAVIEITYSNAPDSVWLTGDIEAYKHDYPQSLPAGIYTFTATHLGCQVIETLEITQPQLSVRTYITENRQGDSISGTFRLVLEEVENLTLDSVKLLTPHGDYESIVLENVMEWNLSQQGRYRLLIYYNGLYTSYSSYTFNLPTDVVTSPEVSFASPLCYGMPGRFVVEGWDTYEYKINSSYNYSYKPSSQTPALWDERIELDLRKTIDVAADPLVSPYIHERRYIVYSLIDSISFPEEIRVDEGVNSNAFIDCYGGNEGAVDLSISGGSGNYEWSYEGVYWNNNTLIEGLKAGIDTIYIRDGDECQVAYEFEIYQNDSLELYNLDIIQPSCELDNGMIQIEATGGQDFKNFYWEHNGQVMTDTLLDTLGTTSFMLDSLPYGNYNLTVFDVLGCRASLENIVLDEYFNPAIRKTETYALSCNSSADGRVEILEIDSTYASATTSSFLLIYEDSVVDSIGANGGFEGLSIGHYDVVAVDSIGCYSEPFGILDEVTQPDSLYVVVDSITPVSRMNGSDGVVYFSIYGEEQVEGFITLWTLDNTGVKRKALSFVNRKDTLAGLSTGVYTLEVEGDRGCGSATDTFTISDPSLPLELIIDSVYDARCYGANGSIVLRAQGGWGNYTIYRLGEDEFVSIDSLYYDTIPAGTYQYVLRDGVGAEFYLEDVVIASVDSIKSQLVVLELPRCVDDGRIEIDITGGTAPYSVWDEALALTQLPSTYFEAINLVGGQSYTFDILDANQCSSEFFVYISDSMQLSIDSIELTNATDFSTQDGRLIAHASGGYDPIGYSWSNYITSILLVDEAEAINLSAGIYKLNVNDNIGCQVSGIYSVASNDVNSTLTLLDSAEVSLYSMSDAYRTLYSEVVSGIDYFYLTWPDNIVTTYMANDSTANFDVIDDTVFIRQLAYGAYSLSAFTGDGDAQVMRLNYTALITQPEEFEILRDSILNVAEKGASSAYVEITASGGNGNYTYACYKTDEELDELIAPKILSANTICFEDLAAGSYRIVVTDYLGYSIEDTVTVEEPERVLDLLADISNPISCYGFSDAEVTLNPLGGWDGYTFSQNKTSYSADAIFDSLSSGNHRFYVKDAMGVEDSIEVMIDEPLELEASIVSVVDVKCFGTSDGLINLAVNGGTAPYYYSLDSVIWKQGTVVYNLQSGNQTIYVRDANACGGAQKLDTVLKEAEALLIDTAYLTHTICNEANGQIIPVVQGGEQPYAYVWTDNNLDTVGFDALAQNLSGNKRYKLTVTDANSCQSSNQWDINFSQNILLGEVTFSQPLCHGDSNAQAEVLSITPAHPYAPYHLEWNNNDTGMIASQMAAGNHYVTVTDTNGCTVSKHITITDVPLLMVEVDNYSYAQCYGYADGMIEVKAIGGTPSYNYEWDWLNVVSNRFPVSKTDDGRLDSLAAGQYAVLVSDANECTASTSFTILHPPQDTVYLGEDVVMCPNSSTLLDGGEFSSYNWFNTADDLLSTDRYYEVFNEDYYRIEAHNEQNCIARDTILIEEGQSALESDFLMSSYAPWQDTLEIYEISNIDLDSLVWEYDTAAFETVSQDGYILKVFSKDTGAFNVTLNAYSSGCMSQITKLVEVLNVQDTVDWYSYFESQRDTLIIDASLDKYVTEDKFTLTVKLKREAKVMTNLYEIGGGLKLDHRTGHGATEYTFTYDISAYNSRSFFLLLSVENEGRRFKVLKK